MLLYQMCRGLSTLLLLACHRADAFRSSILQPTRTIVGRDDTVLLATRRDFMEKAVSSSMVAVAVSSSLAPTAEASGGATAGGVYLLSAKQRYNTRVSRGVASFVALKGALENAEIDTVRSFFTSEDEGSWKDFSAAGYLLANAFRTNSSAAPDTIPSVKKWKAYAAQVEAMTKALKKKDTNGALVAYGDAIVALDEYLGKVELPPAK